MKLVISLFCALALSAGLSQAFAGPQAKGKKAQMEGKMMEPTPEARKMMAEAHDKMAACLKTDKPMKECHMEMKTQCEAMGENCPMHTMMKGHGHHHGAMGKKDKPAKDTKKQ